MSVITRTVLMFIGAILLFMVFAYIDEYESLVAPLFSEDKKPTLKSDVKLDASDVMAVISDFNEMLAEAYATLDPALLMKYPMDKRAQRNYLENLNYLKKWGRTMEMDYGDIAIEEITPVSPYVYKVRAIESVKVRYLKKDDRTLIREYPEINFVMDYVIGWRAKGLAVLNAETVRAGKPAS